MADATPVDQTAPKPLFPVSFPDREPAVVRPPSPMTGFIGRQREVAALAALLRDGDARLVTLTGPGGVGKTRLALRVVEELSGSFTGDVAFVPLAAVTDPDLVIPRIAQALGVREVPGQPPIDRLIEVLRDRRLLLVLDNVEQVVEAGPQIIALLAACPGLKVLVTSRVVLHLSGEQDIAIRPLELPDASPVTSAEAIAQADAVRLFVARAEAARVDFALTDANAPIVAEICRRLDGLPLAIELAAARVAHLPPAALLARMERRLVLLTGGPRDAPVRLRSMRDAIAWSYDLLTSEEQTLFRRLAVFVGGFTLEAAEAVSRGVEESGSRAVGKSRRSARGHLLDSPTSVLDVLASLVDKSLIRCEDGPGAELRYRMLETVREFGLEHLAASGEEEEIRGRHAAVFVALVERDKPPVGSPGPPARVAALEREDANLQAALGWAVERGDAETGLRLVTALAGVYHRGRLREGRTWVERVLAISGEAPRDLRLLAITQRGFHALLLGDNAAAAAAGEQGLAESRVLGDTPGAARALNLLGAVAINRGDPDGAAAVLAEALTLSRQGGDLSLVAWIRSNAGIAASLAGRYNLATACHQESLAIWQELGETGNVANVLCDMAWLARKQGDARRAAQLLREALATAWDVRAEPLVALCFGDAGAMAVATGQVTVAARLFGASDQLRNRLGIPVLTGQQAAYKQDLDTARATLGEEDFMAAWAAGETLPLVEVVAEAEAVLTALAANTGVDAPDALGLSAREREVLRLLADGRSDKEIAEALGIRYRTVTSYVQNILTKLDVPSRTAAATHAIRHGLV